MNEENWISYIKEVVLSNNGSKLVLFEDLATDIRIQITLHTDLLPNEEPVGIYYVDLEDFLLFTNRGIISQQYQRLAKVTWEAIKTIDHLARLRTGTGFIIFSNDDLVLAYKAEGLMDHNRIANTISVLMTYRHWGRPPKKRAPRNG
jgi:hypothetical protein